jgi:flagellar hook-associated protein 2
MDIDELVYNLTATSRARIQKQQQTVQKLEWKQTAYRSVTTALKEFQSKYLDVLSSTNFKSTALFNAVKAASSSSAVTVSSTSSASAGVITIDSVTQLATSASVKSAAAVSKALTGGTTGGTVKTVDTILAEISGGGLAAGDSFNIDLAGNTKTIALDADFFTDLDTDNFAARLQGLIDDAFGEGAVTVSGSGASPLTFTAADGTSVITLSSVGEDTVLSDLGFKEGQSSLARPLTGGETGGTRKTANAIIAGISGGSLAVGDTFSINLDGKSRTITLNTGFFTGLDSSNLAGRLQGLVDDAFGEDMITVSGSGTDPLTFTPREGSKMSFTEKLGGAVLAGLGFKAGQSNTLNTSSALENLTLSDPLAYSSDGKFHFTINNVDFEASVTESLSAVLGRINGSSAGVTISYSSVTDTFTMKASSSGAGNTLTFSDTDGSNFLASLGLSQSNVAAGQNAILRVNGMATDIVRTSNSFNIDGVDITLNSVPTEPVTLTMSDDTSGLVDTVKSFVADYNAMVDLVNGLLKEDKYLDYEPLTDEQKDEMSESEITAWEAKAKSGLLRNDSILRTISSKLHSVMTGLSVNGTSLYSIGITSTGYTENGKLQVNETKLKQALETNITAVKELFTSADGISKKLDSIITAATKTTGAQGSRGTLVEVAGVESTTSETQNSIYDQITRTNKTIRSLQDRLSGEETRYWNKFTAMETALEQLNAQSAMLTQFSSGS